MIKGKYYTLKKRLFLAAKLLKNHDDEKNHSFFQGGCVEFLATNFSVSNGQHVISHDLLHHWAVVV